MFMLPRKTTKIAQYLSRGSQYFLVEQREQTTYAADAATISCRLAFVKADNKAEKTMVERKIRTITSGVFDMVPAIENLYSSPTGTIRRIRTAVLTIIVTQFEIRLRS